MKPFKPIFWVAPIIYKKELKPRRKYLCFGERNQGCRTASNYGFVIVAKEGVSPSVIEQEKFESRYWTLRGLGLYWIWCRLFNPTKLCIVECMSRAQEIRADVQYLKAKGYIQDAERRASMFAILDAHFMVDAPNYPWFARAGWDIERAEAEILKHL